MASRATSKKSRSIKSIVKTVYENDGSWQVEYGELKPAKASSQESSHLFKVLGEKLPFKALAKVRKHVKDNFDHTEGVYVAHDSMGCPRYIGRGQVFQRLAGCKNRHPELQYFSFYLVEHKQHEREIETLLIRSASFLLEFNDKKKRIGISHGNVKDYEAGTHFYERHKKKGRKT